MISKINVLNTRQDNKNISFRQKFISQTGISHSVLEKISESKAMKEQIQTKLLKFLESCRYDFNGSSMKTKNNFYPIYDEIKISDSEKIDVNNLNYKF